ncbi:MAG: TonB-dependent receptor [Chitinispirillaceae bacterium]|nr:TonB-dependent receptor [Chitinispirillaceae bacterium]
MDSFLRGLKYFIALIFFCEAILSSELDSTGIKTYTPDTLAEKNYTDSTQTDTIVNSIIESEEIPDTNEISTSIGTKEKDTSKQVIAISKEVVREETDSSYIVQNLERIVVTATRTKRKISETPASITVITNKEIESSPAKDINDLISNKSSVQIRRVAGMGEGIPSDIIIRGIPGALAANRVLVLVDGVPTNASGTPFLIVNEIPIEIVDNIEIVRGPYSSLYGANAFGGVMNVVTKKGDGPPSVSGVFETSYPFNVLNSKLQGTPTKKAAKDGLSQSFWNGNFTSEGGNEKINFLLSGGYRSIGNYLLRDSALVKASNSDYVFIPARNYDYADLRLFNRIGGRINERISWELHTRYFSSDLGFGYTKYLPDTVIDINIKGKKIITGPQINYHATDNLDIRIGGYLRRIFGSYINELNGQPIEWKPQQSDWQGELQAIYRLDKSQIITAGAEHLSNKIIFGDFVNLNSDSVIGKGTTAKISNSGVFIQDEILFAKRFRIVPGIRVDYHNMFGLAISPKLGASATINEKIRLRTSVGRAFRGPNHSELFMPPLPLMDNVTIHSNPNLKPEYLIASDIGVDYMPLSNLKIGGGLFFNRMDDLISQGVKLDTTGGNISAYVTHENISIAWCGGAEFEGEWEIIKGLFLKGNYVFQKSRNKTASEMASYFKKIYRDLKDTLISLDYIPEHKGGFGFLYSKKFKEIKLSLSIDGLVVGERTYQNFSNVQMGKNIILDLTDQTFKVNPPLEKLPPYFRLDFMLRGELGNRVWMLISVQNCFNAKYEESFGTLAPGRFASVKIGIR